MWLKHLSYQSSALCSYSLTKNVKYSCVFFTYSHYIADGEVFALAAEALPTGVNS
jgi:hypothetical protein